MCPLLVMALGLCLLHAETASIPSAIQRPQPPYDAPPTFVHKAPEQNPPAPILPAPAPEQSLNQQGQPSLLPAMSPNKQLASAFKPNSFENLKPLGPTGLSQKPASLPIKLNFSATDNRIREISLVRGENSRLGVVALPSSPVIDKTTQVIVPVMDPPMPEHLSEAIPKESSPPNLLTKPQFQIPAGISDSSPWNQGALHHPTPFTVLVQDIPLWMLSENNSLRRRALPVQADHGVPLDGPLYKQVMDAIPVATFLQKQTFYIKLAAFLIQQKNGEQPLLVVQPSQLILLPAEIESMSLDQSTTISNKQLPFLIGVDNPGENRVTHMKKKQAAPTPDESDFPQQALPVPNMSLDQLLPGCLTVPQEVDNVIQVNYLVKLAYMKVNVETCVGSILNEKWVLIAAHCIYLNKAQSDESVILGPKPIKEQKMLSISDGSQLLTVGKYIVHEDYHVNSKGFPVNDVALLKLEQSISFSPLSRPVCIPSREMESKLHPDTCVVVDWDFSHSRGSSKPILRPVTPLSSCADISVELSQAAVCSIYDSSMGNCPGDSGGPLFCNHKLYSLPINIGLASFGTPSKKELSSCRLNVDIVGQTHISQYFNWIIESMIENGFD
ncbi:uncharacterized protein LOC127526051 [Erpetoichthys calabaricus]|uniref:uncharacterized protein LOC127526051 n=1 Tax=Erpetoichthys calabaricus TaxID=27687 RepID=UPI002233FF2D|nr:uncharacterized protein LOC127526051 [Erpetoichthys calabaricus]